MEEPEALLKHLGLTEYEAKAVLVLLKNGKSTAERISNLGSIPLPRVYDTMGGLAERGLIIISKTRPQTFKPIDTKRFFDLLKDNERKKIEEKVSIIDTIAPQFISKIGTITQENIESSIDDELSLVRKRLNIDDILSEIYRKTKSELLIFAGDMSWLKRRNKEIRNSIRKKVSIKILSNEPYKDVLKMANSAVNLGAEVKFCDDKNLIRGFVSDHKTVCIVKKQKDIKSPEYSSIILTNEMLADVFRKYFYILWEKSKGLDSISKRFK